MPGKVNQVMAEMMDDEPARDQYEAAFAAAAVVFEKLWREKKNRKGSKAPRLEVVIKSGTEGDRARYCNMGEKGGKAGCRRNSAHQ
jgi:hypothetical protein